MLPKFNGGLLADWQAHREYQRRIAKETFEQTRPAAGTSLHFDRLFLIELFQIEDIDYLEARLRPIFAEVHGLNQIKEDLRSFSIGRRGDLFSVKMVFLGPHYA